MAITPNRVKLNVFHLIHCKDWTCGVGTCSYCKYAKYFTKKCTYEISKNERRED